MSRPQRGVSVLGIGIALLVEHWSEWSGPEVTGLSLYFKTECKHFSEEALNLAKQERAEEAASREGAARLRVGRWRLHRLVPQAGDASTSHLREPPDALHSLLGASLECT